jgi:nucleoside phosphorylase
MAATTKKKLNHSEYTVAIICPLEVEMSAVRYMLDVEHAKLPSKEGDLNRYIIGEMSGHNVVVGFLPVGTQGIGAAATVCTDMRRTFPNATLRLLVGIGGGVPSATNDVRLGDVVVGIPSGIHGGVVQYNLGKETTTGFERKGFLQAPPRHWRDAIVEMNSDHRVKKNRISEYLSEMIHQNPALTAYSCPASETDILFSPDSTHIRGQPTCDQCDHGRVVERTARPSGGPIIHYGLIASGDKVMKNAEMRDEISKDLGGVLCFEMEAAGLMNDFQCIVIRGISDYSDSHKNDNWHAYGAATAAGCAKELLTYIEPIVG